MAYDPLLRKHTLNLFSPILLQEKTTTIIMPGFINIFPVSNTKTTEFLFYTLTQFLSDFTSKFSILFPT